MLIFEKPKLPRSLGLGYFYFDIGTCLFFGICDLEFHIRHADHSGDIPLAGDPSTPLHYARGDWNTK